MRHSEHSQYLVSDGNVTALLGVNYNNNSQTTPEAPEAKNQFRKWFSCSEFHDSHHENLLTSNSSPFHRSCVKCLPTNLESNTYYYRVAITNTNLQTWTDVSTEVQDFHQHHVCCPKRALHFSSGSYEESLYYYYYDFILEGYYNFQPSLSAYDSRTMSVYLVQWFTPT